MGAKTWGWEIWGAFLGLLGFVAFWVLLAGGVAWTGISELRRGFSTVDLSARCSPGESSGCLSDQWARVESVDSSGYTTLTYDDGRRTWEVDLLGDADPEPGTRLLIEHWGDDPVSLYGPVQDIRYRTEWWPRRWSPEGLIMTAVGALLLGALLALVAVGIVVRVQARRDLRRTLQTRR